MTLTDTLPSFGEWATLMDYIEQLEEERRQSAQERAQLRREVAELHIALEDSKRLSLATQIAMNVLEGNVTGRVRPVAVPSGTDTLRERSDYETTIT
jgi:hypothetical protein